MIITYHGGQSFKASFGDTTIAFDPVSKESKKFPVSKFGADAAFISLKHSDFNGRDQVSHGSRQPFVADGPGEYEIGEVKAHGFGVLTTYDGEPKYNTIYQVQFEGINMVFLGALNDPEIDPKILGELGDIDILFMPVGGGDVLEVPQASKLAVKLEARIIIPMHYDKTSLAAFLKEEGVPDLKAEEKLTIKKKDLLAMEGEIVVLGA
jgi:L-ascorbate metabolism protein UlaG (beta-lactamase superfamily)